MTNNFWPIANKCQAEENVLEKLAKSAKQVFIKSHQGRNEALTSLYTESD